MINRNTRTKKLGVDIEKAINDLPLEHRQEVFASLVARGYKTNDSNLKDDFKEVVKVVDEIKLKIHELNKRNIQVRHATELALKKVDDKNFESIEVTKKNIATLAESVESISIKADKFLDTMKALNVRMRFSKMFYLITGALIGVMFSQTFNFIVKLYCYAPESPKFIYILCGLGGLLPGVIIGAFLSNRN